MSKIEENWLNFIESLIISRYADRDKNDGKPLYSSFDNLIDRIYNAFTNKWVSKKELLDKVKKQLGEKFVNFICGKVKESKELLKKKYLLASTPIYMSWGSPSKHSCHFACFPLIPPDDSLESIFLSALELAFVFRAGGGAGLDLSNLRPKNALVDNSQGIASGPVSFASLYAAIAKVIEQGGRRRAALMLTLLQDHPDLLEFISCKDTITKDSVLHFCNISVKINNFDKFKSSGLLKELADHAWTTGDPGLLFMENQLKSSPLYAEYEPFHVNPCAEYMSVAGTACNLWSVNLFDLALKSKKSYPEFFNLVEKVGYYAVILGSYVLLFGRYPSASEPFSDLLNYISYKTRFYKPVGVGFTGLHEAMAYFHIPYDSSEGVNFAMEAQKALLKGTAAASLDLAEKVNQPTILTPSDVKFYGYDSKSRPKEPLMLNNFPKLRLSNYLPDDPEFGELRSRLEYLGFAFNCVTTSQMPTGSVSQLAALASTGLEPIFDKEFDRKVYHLFDGDWKTFHIVSRLKDIDREAFDKYLKSALDIDPEWHLKIQSAVQKYCHTSVSKTINLPNDFSKEELENLFEKAFSLGLKSITVFRTGCREDEVLTSKSTHNKKSYFVSNNKDRNYSFDIDKDYPARRFRIRPRFGGDSVYLKVTLDPEDELYPVKETFLDRSRSGTMAAAAMEALAISLSTAFQESPETAIKILERIQGIDDGVPVLVQYYGKPYSFRSMYDAISFILLSLMKNKSDKIKIQSDINNNNSPIECIEENAKVYDICPNCGNYSLYRSGGCLTCKICTYSTC